MCHLISGHWSSNLLPTKVPVARNLSFVKSIFMVENKFTKCYPAIKITRHQRLTGLVYQSRPVNIWVIILKASVPSSWYHVLKRDYQTFVQQDLTFFLPTLIMTSPNGNIFCFADPLWGESTSHQWIPLTKASKAELWCFLWSALEQTIEQIIEMPVIWYCHHAHYDITLMYVFVLFYV